MRAFFAYPSSPKAIGACIEGAVDRILVAEPDMQIQLWERHDVSGRPLTDPVELNIENADVVFADITRLNFNVVFEIGFAIALKKRVMIVKNVGLSDESTTIQKIGLFDTLGYVTYENSIELERIIEGVDDFKSLSFASTVNKKNPVFLVDTPVRSDVMLRISSAIKKSRLGFRSFNPSEDPRLSASFAIEQVANSLGVVIPIVHQDERESSIHNIRAAFVAGLAVGMRKETLILSPIDGPIYLDIRDITRHYRNIGGAEQRVVDFTYKVHDLRQEPVPEMRSKISRLAALKVGDPMAENEFSTLGRYYVQTDPFQRAMRGEVNVVIGRKGTGKTALFSQVRDRVRSSKENIVVDLKPEGYQLVKLKEELLAYASVGVQTHLLVAFWEYILVLEIAYKILEKRSRPSYAGSWAHSTLRVAKDFV